MTNYCTLRYCIFIKSFSVSFFRKFIVFIYDYESILLLPTATTRFAEILVRHVSVYIIVYMFQIGIVLFEQAQQICIIAYFGTFVYVWHR